MMSDFEQVFIIFNPNSTGDSKTIAKDFRKAIKAFQPSLKVKLCETTHAGHAEELGYQLSKKFPSCLLVSVSGDGGYHELINGAMSAVDEGAAEPICTVLPGGNANDHYSFVSKRSLLEAIEANGLTRLDLLKVVSTKTRYAHSYVGLGLTPRVALELNKHDLTLVKEMWLSLRTFWRLKPFRIIQADKTYRLDSLIMANIGVMAKHLTLDDNSSPRDGKFEVLRWSHSHKLRLVIQILRSAVGAVDSPRSVEQFEFITVSNILMQLDGEIEKLKAGQKVLVTSAHRKLRTYR